ncbi:LysM peptidoglycan-binding domain-containing protein [Alicyclobacillaceae bacterium I2511]|nr:LysM peptidoglycan-binding domain-containing protein [Alicyclobacillaceae bacterium I2511]
MWSIATQYKISIVNLEKWNNLKSDKIFPNQILHIVSTPLIGGLLKDVKSKPIGEKTGHYIVLPGDTLWNIGVRKGISVQALMAANHLRTTLLLPGEQLRIPSSSRVNELSSRQGSVDTHGVPVDLLSAYEDAGQRFGIPWTVLAAIHKVETDFCTTNCPDSYAGAVGPMQFLPQTFAMYATLAPWHTGTADIENVYDAIYTAAHMLAANGFARNPFAAIFSYNHSDSYVESVLSLARQF